MRRFVFGVMVLLLTSPAFAELPAVSTSPNSDWANEIDRSGPAATRTQLGTRLRGVLKSGNTNNSAHSTVATANADVVNDTYTTPSTRTVTITTGAALGESERLEDGVIAGDKVTFILGTDGGRNYRNTPRTTTGFTHIELDDAKDSVTLEWNGSAWFIAGNNGATIS